MASCWIDFDGSGTTSPMSSSMTLPKPWQVGHAPNGLLKENSRGCGTSYSMRQERHSKRSLNSCSSGSPPCAAAVPGPGGHLDGERRAPALGVAGLDGIGKPREDVPSDRHPVDDHLQSGAPGERLRIELVEGDRPVLDEQPSEALPPQRLERAGHGVGARQDGLRARRAPAPRCARAGGPGAPRAPAGASPTARRRLGIRSAAVALRAGRGRCRADRQIEPRSTAASRRAAPRGAGRRPRRSRERPPPPQPRQIVRPTRANSRRR